MFPPPKPEPGPRLRLVSAPWSSLYDLPVDAIVEEQDTNRLLGLEPLRYRPESETYPRLVQAAEATRPAALGKLLPFSGRPLRLQAIVLDLEQGRKVELIHLRRVAERLCELIDRQPIRRLGMPVLGKVYGDVSVASFAGIFAPRLRATSLETLYLMTGPDPTPLELRQLRRAFASGRDAGGRSS